ncbi:hypothetical protein PTKIN_Ptkin06aG0113700 [Pterospermum kingtungense]
MFDDYIQVVSTSGQLFSTSGEGWTPPEEGILKINVDAVTQLPLQQAVVGIVMRDHDGSVFLSAALTVRGAESILHAELLAILHGLKVARDVSLTHNTVESDCLLAVNKVLKGVNSFSKWSYVTRDIFFTMKLFENCILIHTKCGSNRLADVVYKTRCLSDDHTVWWHCLTPDVCNYDVISQ